MNFYARNKAAMDATPSFGDGAENKRFWNALVNQSNKGLDKMPKYKGTVFRGTDNMSIEAIRAYEKALKSGDTHIEPGFFSTSPVLQRQFGTQVTYQIKSKNGASLDKVSAHAHEDEVLFKAGTGFKVTRFTKTKNGKVLIEMEEI